jgi:hypothetical protein
MNRALEVFYLPLLFLTVTLLGGMRVADRLVFVPPPLSALILAVLFVGVLIRSGAVAPQRLLHSARTPLANVSGAAVLLATFAGAVQAFNLVIPESGLPRLIATIFLFVLVVNTFAARPDRAHVLRSAAVILGSMFVLKFIVLTALSDPGGGWLKRMLLAAVEGITLGTLTQAPLATVTGYVAFVALLLFLAGLALLPARESSSSTLVARRRDPLGSD